MRVAFVLAGTDWGRSGIGTYVRAVLPHLAHLLREDGHRLVCIGDDRDYEAYADVLEGVSKTRIPPGLDRPLLSAATYMAGTGIFARRARADVLLLPAANRRTTFLSLMPTVAVIHDLAQLHVPDKYDPLRMTYFRQVVLRSMKRADQIVAVSEATRRDVIEAGGIASRTRVVPNGVDYERFFPLSQSDEAVVRAKSETGLAGPYILYAARLEHPGKNHIRLIRAFAASGLSDTHTLALAGKDWGAEARIRSEIQTLNLHGKVKLLGFVSDAILPGLVAGSAAVAMVGLHEGFGLPALEALAAGVPVLASNAGALPEVVGSLAPLCDPLDESSIAAALLKTLRDDETRSRAISEGPDWARKWGWDRTASGLIGACEDALLRRHMG